MTTKDKNLGSINVMDFAKIIGNGPQYGRLYFHHYLGINLMMKIYILDTDEKIDDITCYENKVEVYGQKGFKPVWGIITEPVFGWLEEGKWQEDVQKIITDLHKKEHEAGSIKKSGQEIMDSYGNKLQ